MSGSGGGGEGEEGRLVGGASQPADADASLRPKRLAEFIGQAQLKSNLAVFVEAARARGEAMDHVLFAGPPGLGKTTLAQIVAAELGVGFRMTSGPIIQRAGDLAALLTNLQPRDVLFIDEIHRYNRAQQDGLLHEVEAGTVSLIGATTENPSFALNPALISRCLVVVLDRLDDAALLQLLDRAEVAIGHALPLEPPARARLAELADGDGRYLLNMVESLADLPGEPALDVEAMGHVLSRRLPIYDKQQEAHYNLISALHKSVRGSDPDAALYWLCRMLEGGEDPRYIARRMIRMANEDIGLAQPEAVVQAVTAAEVYERLGSPEGELALAQVVVHLALAPKSNAIYRAFGAARRSAKEHGSLMPPAHILNAPTKLMKALGYGQGYAYDHDAPDHFSGQGYFPEGMERPSFYHPTEEGLEKRLKEKLQHLAGLRRARGSGEGGA
ncbi:MAG: replication-associated recombination protein A [Geminicoccaceae bacterium]